MPEDPHPPIDTAINALTPRRLYRDETEGVDQASEAFARSAFFVSQAVLPAMRAGRAKAIAEALADLQQIGDIRMITLDPFGYGTHEVLNQAPAMADYDAYAGDPTLALILDMYGAKWAEPHIRKVGRTVGSAHVQELARQANRNLPELQTHDRWGTRIDQVEFHPAWHELMSLGIRDEFHSLCWSKPQPGAQVARAAVSYLWNQGENGICCPLGMTYSAIPVLRRDPARWAEWGHLIMSTKYDRRQIPAAQKTGGTVGMAMTEKQGGSDLRQTQTIAEPNADGTYSLVGHKWFFSVPHSDVFLTLARTAEGVSCFVVPGWLPDGSRNRLQLQRLKDKCGNKSNASSEVEFRGVIGHLIGEPGPESGKACK